MTTKNIKTSDILGSNYYTYELSSSNYTPSLNANITITCTLKNVYGTVQKNKSLTLYKNGSSVSSQTTDNSGVATWSNISCTSSGLQKFTVGTESIEVFVDDKASSSHTHTTSEITNFPSTMTPSSHAHGNLQNDGSVGTSNNASKNVVTDSNGKITTEAKPTIPSKTSDLTNDSGFLTSHQDISNYVQKSNTTGLLKNDGTVDTSTYLTSHQSLTNYVQKSSTTGLIKNDGTIDTSSYITSSSLPTKTSDLTNDGSSSSDSLVYVETSSTTGLIKNDGTIDTTTYSTFTGSYNDLSNKPSIPSSSSDLSDGSSLVKTSNTTGLIKNDGSIDSSSYITSSSLPTKTSDLTNDGADGTNVFVANDDSRLSDTRNPKAHNHGNIDSDGVLKFSNQPLANVIVKTGTTGAFTGVSHLSSDNIKDGTAHSNIGSSANATQSTINTKIDDALATKITKVTTATGLLKDDGSVDTSSYITSSAISGMLTSGDIANNLTTTTTGKVLDASQGKALADLIGNAITYINQ